VPSWLEGDCCIVGGEGEGREEEEEEEEGRLILE